MPIQCLISTYKLYMENQVKQKNIIKWIPSHTQKFIQLRNTSCSCYQLLEVCCTWIPKKIVVNLKLEEEKRSNSHSIDNHSAISLIWTTSSFLLCDAFAYIAHYLSLNKHYFLKNIISLKIVFVSKEPEEPNTQK